VTQPDREEPHLNPSFQEFAAHYGLATLPARAARPTDKGGVEGAVKIVQVQILLALPAQPWDWGVWKSSAILRISRDRGQICSTN